jgi:hypothetical protein
MEEQSAHTHTHDHAHCFCCEANERIGQFFRSRRRASEEAKSHFRQSRIEFLKGLRKILDDRIDDLGRAEQRGTHVPVD